MTRTVLVTGANGFVGRHTLAALQAMSDVRTVALLRDPRRLPPDFDGEVRQGDIRDPVFITRALDGIDAICMAAAWTSAWRHPEESRMYFLEPVLGFLDAAVESGVRRIVFPSSTTAPVLRRLASNSPPGAQDDIWPHMSNVNRIEDHMRVLAARGTSMVALRLGLFVGAGYGLGMLPLLLPRLRTHLVPWVSKGRTALPLVAGEDIGRALALAATCDRLDGWVTMDIVGKEVPTVREVFRFLHDAYGYPLPHFGVSFSMAYVFARFMESVSRVTPWDPFLTRSIVLLLEETTGDNREARRLMGYEPLVHWKDAIRAQLAEMQRDGVQGLPMARANPAPLAKPVS